MAGTSIEMLERNGNDKEIVFRSFTFVVLEQLPSMGSKLIRKVGILEYNDILNGGIAAPSAKPYVSFGEHAMGVKPSQYLSHSSSPFGSPTNILEGAPPGNAMLVDINAFKKAGGSIHSTEEIIADLKRIAATNPSQAQRIDKLINMIKSVEFEVLTQGDIPAKALSKVGPLHSKYITSAEQIMYDFKYEHSDWGKAQRELANLKSQYKGARITGQVFRVVRITGVVLTVYDLANATNKSFEQKSSNPLVAESIRQVGGWGAGWLGFKAGCAAGALVGIETGPGAVVTCAIGAIGFGYAGYKGADWLADYIDEN